jgi:hypothetical protein
MKGVVVNMKEMGFRWERDDVDISRSGYFGNRFVIGRDGNREDVIEKFERWARKEGVFNEEYRERVKGLYGKRLVCWCKPLKCHGDILMLLSEEWISEDVE